MKINHNMSAVIANNQLLRNENSLSDVMERLSSGLKLNHAKDDPAGMAISHKMQTQIDGLDRASQNASDGSNVVEIADGALNEVTEMLQRMRELSVQAANDTNSDSDKAAIQDEIAQLKEEIDRISDDTEYNTMGLLDGSRNSRVYSKNVSRLQASSYVDTGIYNLTINSAAEQADYTGGAIPSGEYSGKSGSISINGYIVNINNGDSQEEIYEKIRNGAEKGECTLESDMGDPIELKSTAYGKDAEITITGSADVLAYLGMVDNTASPAVGKDADITLGDPFTSKATTKYEGNKMTITDGGGFELSFLADSGYTGDIAIDVTDIGSMTLQIGANQHQTIDVEIPEVSCDMLYIDDLDVTTVTGADRAITALDSAIEYVNQARSKLGAYENRLDYAISDLETSGENMTAALSGITDADMAEEMVDYTQYNVLQQAGVSVLSQANDLPQTVLQILQ